MELTFLDNNLRGKNYKCLIFNLPNVNQALCYLGLLITPETDSNTDFTQNS